MTPVDPLDRRALEILSEAVAEKLGHTDQIVLHVLRASSTGAPDDRARARSAFDALPDWQRVAIGYAARSRARASVEVPYGGLDVDPDVPGDRSLPRFLLGRESGADGA